MARSPIEIGIASETRAFKQGVENGIIQPLEDAEKQLKKLGDADAGRDLERDLNRAQDASEDLSTEVDTTRRGIERLGWAARDAGEDASASFRRIGDKGAEVSGELRQNLGETFASFRGDLRDLPQIAQDTLGGLAGSGALGGIPGLAATAAGAAGLGLLIGAMDNISAAQEELKQQARDWAETYIENGSRVLDMSTIMAKTQAVLNDRLSEAETNAKDWGVSVDTAVAAMAGSTSAIDEVTRAVEAQEAANRAAADAAAERGSTGLEALREEAVAADHGRQALDRLTGAMSLGATQADIYSRIMVDQARATAGATEKVDEFGDRVISLPTGVQVYVDAETGQATSNVDAIQAKVYSTNGQRATVIVDADTSAADAKLASFRRRAQEGISVNVSARTSIPGVTLQ